MGPGFLMFFRCKSQGSGSDGGSSDPSTNKQDEIIRLDDDEVFALVKMILETGAL